MNHVVVRNPAVFAPLDRRLMADIPPGCCPWSAMTTRGLRDVVVRYAEGMTAISPGSRSAPGDRRTKQSSTPEGSQPRFRANAAGAAGYATGDTPHATGDTPQSGPRLTDSLPWLPSPPARRGRRVGNEGAQATHTLTPPRRCRYHPPQRPHGRHPKMQCPCVAPRCSVPVLPPDADPTLHGAFRRLSHQSTWARSIVSKALSIRSRAELNESST